MVIMIFVGVKIVYISHCTKACCDSYQNQQNIKGIFLTENINYIPCPLQGSFILTLYKCINHIKFPTFL